MILFTLLLLCFMSCHSMAAVDEIGRAPERGTAASLGFIGVSEDGQHFVYTGSGRKFTPWGFNYDHDREGRLLESYWAEEWGTVAEDFAEMKALGANTVRIHLQLGRFMRSPTEPERESLQLLSRLLELAEETGLWLDLTGLGCYRKPEVPEWYNALAEQERWEVQARFWEAVAQTCSGSPAIFCYDLMNEPILTEDSEGRDWTPGEFGGLYFVQRITLDHAGRTREEIAKAWVAKLAGAIRKHDKRHLITVGAIPWAHTWPKAKPFFYSKEVAAPLDFVSLHFYPKAGEVTKALEALAVYEIGKPIVIEEMFPLSCSVEELDEFLGRSRPLAAGWIGFYWGKTIADYEEQEERSIAEELTLGWLRYFRNKTKETLADKAYPASTSKRAAPSGPARVGINPNAVETF